MKRTLGTQLRHLIEQLDGAVQQSYDEVGLDYRARYTPVMRVLIERGVASVGEVAQAAGISQPAATQTIALMVATGIASTEFAEDDGRRRVVRLTEKGRAMVPRLQRRWRATACAADSLDRELSVPLGQILEEALAALDRLPYGERIRRAAEEPADRPGRGSRRRRGPAEPSGG